MIVILNVTTAASAMSAAILTCVIYLPPEP